MNKKPDLLFLRVYAALLFLLIGTVGIAFLHIGVFTVIAALSIAAVQTVLIVLYFMRLRASDRLNWIVAGASLLWLGILFVLVTGDYATRT
jgi:cytochrome c oxidase subunit IV